MKDQSNVTLSFSLSLSLIFKLISRKPSQKSSVKGPKSWGDSLIKKLASFLYFFAPLEGHRGLGGGPNSFRKKEIK